MPWILVAAGVVIVWVLFGRGRRSGKLKPPAKRDALILIEGNPDHKVSVDTDPIRKNRGASVLWEVEDNSGHQHTVSITFPGPDPLSHPPHDNAHDPTKIHAVVSRTASDGHYKYEVRLDGNLALDPDLEVRGG